MRLMSTWMRHMRRVPTDRLRALVVAAMVVAVVVGSHVTVPRNNGGSSGSSGSGSSSGSSGSIGNGGFAPRIEFRNGPSGEVWT
jgi:hypothetical protein